jgi:hypothetical protein
VSILSQWFIRILNWFRRGFIIPSLDRISFAYHAFYRSHNLLYASREDNGVVAPAFLFITTRPIYRTTRSLVTILIGRHVILYDSSRLSNAIGRPSHLTKDHPLLSFTVPKVVVLLIHSPFSSLSCLLHSIILMSCPDSFKHNM